MKNFITIEITKDLFCNVCGDKLEVNEQGNSLYINPCETCLEKARKENQE